MMHIFDDNSPLASQNSKLNSDPTQQDLHVLIKQLNLQKSKVATANFAKCMIEWSRCSLFALLQEPATTTKGKIEFLPPGTQVFAASQPCAAILATPDL